MFQNLRAMSCATAIALAGGANASAGTVIELEQYQACLISWSGGNGCYYNTYWNHDPTILCGGFCSLNTQTYQYGGKRIGMWSFDLSQIPMDAEVVALTLRASGGDHSWSQEGRIFKLGMKTGVGLITENDGLELFNQGVDFAQPAPLVETEYVLSTIEINDAIGDTGWLAMSVSENYNEMIGVLAPEATLIVEYETTSCAADIDDSGKVDVMDLLTVISSWGPCIACDADTDGNGAVDVGDLLAVIDGWGTCG
ncbi:MAG: hypothetical protein P8I74_06050 [Phycisphaerales bacterium]|nr:hypothetical protein [Phycisphaerales bacterium]